jgi:hypothetical protein
MTRLKWLSILALAACTSPPHYDFVPPATVESRTALEGASDVIEFERFRAEYPGLCTVGPRRPTACFVSSKVYGRPKQATDPGTWEHLGLVLMTGDVLCYFRAYGEVGKEQQLFGSLWLSHSGETGFFLDDDRYFDTSQPNWRAAVVANCEKLLRRR